VNLAGTSEEILRVLQEKHLEVDWILEAAQGMVPWGKKQILPYQAAALYSLVRPYNCSTKRILEIGTYYGYSTAVIALGAPAAAIITLNPLEWEVVSATHNLRSLRNVSFVQTRSWEYLERDSSTWDLIFVDADHERIHRDLPWFNHLSVGGLILFHDYAPPEATYKPCRTVYNAIQGMVRDLQRDLDVLVVDDRLFGMAGFYRREGEILPVGG